MIKVSLYSYKFQGKEEGFLTGAHHGIIDIFYRLRLSFLLNKRKQRFISVAFQFTSANGGEELSMGLHKDYCSGGGGIALGHEMKILISSSVSAE